MNDYPKLSRGVRESVHAAFGKGEAYWTFADTDGSTISGTAPASVDAKGYLRVNVVSPSHILDNWGTSRMEYRLNLPGKVKPNKTQRFAWPLSGNVLLAGGYHQSGLANETVLSHAEALELNTRHIASGDPKFKGLTIPEAWHKMLRDKYGRGFDPEDPLAVQLAEVETYWQEQPKADAGLVIVTRQFQDLKHGAMAVYLRDLKTGKPHIGYRPREDRSLVRTQKQTSRLSLAR